MSATPLRERPFDAFLVFAFSVFSISSLIYEQFVAFGIDLSTTTDVFGRSWYWYARSFDPVFLDPPLHRLASCRRSHGLPDLRVPADPTSLAASRMTDPRKIGTMRTP